MNLQVISAPDGFPLWVSEARPGRERIDLEFATQPGSDDQACAAMTFEVPFDDGATWKEVTIDREGDLASAELRLPEDPGFVSVRFTAADEAGSTVEHTTVRSYGIR